MFLTWHPGKKLISFFHFGNRPERAFVAFLTLVTTGVIRWGSRYTRKASSPFGVIIISFISSGFDLYRKLHIMEFKNTLFPVPGCACYEKMGHFFKGRHNRVSFYVLAKADGEL